MRMEVINTGPWLELNLESTGSSEKCGSEARPCVQGRAEADGPKGRGGPHIKKPRFYEEGPTVKSPCEVTLPSLGFSFLTCEAKREELAKSSGLDPFRNPVEASMPSPDELS